VCPLLTSAGGLLGLALMGLQRPCRADEAVMVRCAALSAEDAAELEARVRTSLLAGASPRALVRVECDPPVAYVVAIAGERRESVTFELPHSHAKERLLDGVEQTLEMLARPQAPSTPDSALAPGRMGEDSLRESPRTAASQNRQPERVRARPPPQGINPIWRLGMSAIVELWAGQFAYGGRARVEVAWSPWSVGLAMGGLVRPDGTDAYTATEWHALVFERFEWRPLWGLCGLIGLGASFLVVEPASGIMARSPTRLSSAFVAFGLSRPVRVRRWTLLPEMSLRLALAHRELHLDHQTELELPRALPAVLLGANYEF
jgi:hypothetical protein